MSLKNKIVCVDYLFRGKEHRITYFIENNNCIKLEIEDKISLNEWIGSFTSDYIEDLTKKTGNFKSFDVFSAMLQTVLVETSDMLTLDLMTYNDLQELRKLKFGSGKVNVQQTNQDVNQLNKRYLILTYSTEFDKIHYPLPLQYQGVPDIRQLKQTILQLRQANNQPSNNNNNSSEFEQFESNELKKKLITVKSENDQLQSLLHKYKVNLYNSPANEELIKELTAAKSIVQNLQQELAEDKSRHQRILMKKNREIKSLTDELLELKSTKRNLNFRLTSLTNELATYRRQRTSQRSVHSPRPPLCPSPSKSALELLVPRRSHTSGLLSDPETSCTTRGRKSGLSGPRNRTRKVSTGSLVATASPSYQPRAREHTSRRCVSADRYNYRNTSPNPPKFNPTAYVEQKKIKRQVIEEKRRQQIRSRINSGGSSNGRYSDRSCDSSPLSTTRYPRATVANNNISDSSDLDSVDREPINGYRSDDSSINGAINNGSSSERKSFRFRRKLLDSEDEDTPISNNTRSYYHKPSRASPQLSKSHRSNRSTHNSADPLHFSHSRSNNQFSKSSNSHNHRVVQSNATNIDDIQDIDHRLNALQEFFQKYLHSD